MRDGGEEQKPIKPCFLYFLKSLLIMEETFEGLNNQLQGLCVLYYQHKDPIIEAQWVHLVRLAQTIKQKINLKKDVAAETLSSLSELVNTIFDLENKISFELARANVDEIGPYFISGLDPLRHQVDEWPPPTHMSATRIFENVEASLAELAFYFGLYKDQLNGHLPTFVFSKGRLNTVKVGLKLEEMLHLSCRGNVVKFQSLLAKFRDGLREKGINITPTIE